MRLRLMVVLLIVFLSGFALPDRAGADASATWQGKIGNTKTWITVVPQGHTISASTRAKEPWWLWGNTTSDAYIFAFDRPDNVRLILAFQQGSGGVPVASIYLNQQGKAPLDYVLQGDRLSIHTAGGRPYLTMRPDQGQWVVQGKSNFKLSLDVDGPIVGFGDSHAQTDGTVDVRIRVGSDQPGIPQWETWRLLYDPHPDHGYTRFGANQRLENAPTYKMASPLMANFPFLGIGAGNIDWFVENPNPLYFDLSHSEFDIFPFAGFFNGGSYGVNSLSAPPNVDFESPFAFYNFDPSNRYAQLVVRAHGFPEGDHFGAQPTDTARSSFRYSWKTSDSTRWRYSLNVAGSFPFTESVQIGDARLSGVSGSQLPAWVSTKPWPMVSFVEADQGFTGSEGIYFYNVQALASSWDWLVGSNTRPAFLEYPYLQPDATLRSQSDEALPPGFRGEYNAAGSRPPALYVSTVDNRLHLQYAQGGVWNLGNGQVVRLHNLTGGPYIDGWTRERLTQASDAKQSLPQATPGEVLETLYALKGYFVYGGASGVTLRQGAPALSVLETEPPTDKASWASFVSRLAPFEKQRRDPKDLAAWLSGATGKTMSIAQAQLSDVRTTEKGFRFVLNLQPGFSAQGADLLPLSGLKPGKYVVTYEGQFSTAPLTPAQLSLAAGVANGEKLAATQPAQLVVSVTNKGLQDARGIILRVTARLGNSSVDLGSHVIDAFAKQPSTVSLNWQPFASGPWHLEFDAQDATGKVLAKTLLQADVAASGRTSLQSLAGVSNVGRWRLFLFLGLALCSFVAIVTARTALNRLQEGDRRGKLEWFGSSLQSQESIESTRMMAVHALEGGDGHEKVADAAAAGDGS